MAKKNNEKVINWGLNLATATEAEVRERIEQMRADGFTETEITHMLEDVKKAKENAASYKENIETSYEIDVDEKSDFYRPRIELPDGCYKVIAAKVQRKGKWDTLGNLKIKNVSEFKVDIKIVDSVTGAIEEKTLQYKFGTRQCESFFISRLIDYFKHTDLPTWYYDTPAALLLLLEGKKPIKGNNSKCPFKIGDNGYPESEELSENEQVSWFIQKKKNGMFTNYNPCSYIPANYLDQYADDDDEGEWE